MSTETGSRKVLSRDEYVKLYLCVERDKAVVNTMTAAQLATRYSTELKIPITARNVRQACKSVGVRPKHSQGSNNSPVSALHGRVNLMEECLRIIAGRLRVDLDSVVEEAKRNLLSESLKD